MLETLKILFWMASFLVVYAYAGYPFLLAVLARSFPYRERPGDAPLPTVTLVISAYNEAAVIHEKLKNSFSLDYPEGLLDILVVSDSSTDGTDEIVQSFASKGARLVRQTQRLGKSAGLNSGLAQATGEIVVFSDANALYRSDAIRRLVRHFASPNVGYVVGNARYADQPGLVPSAESEGLYWKLETWLKQKESDFGSVVGGDGAIYAIRRELFTPLLPTDINDFLNPLQIIARGYRGVYEREAVCYEDAGDSFEKEFRRKSRIVSRSLNALRRVPSVLLPWTQPRHWFALVSHKILRWFAPVFLIAAGLCTIPLWSILFYRLLLLLQVLFYSLAATGWFMERRATAPRLVYLPYYFCLVNCASLLGILKCFQGALSPTWETIRQPTSADDESVAGAVRRES